MQESLRAWRPEVPGVQEVLHATFAEHAYPAHTHDSWTVLLIDEGAVAYELERTERRATPMALTLLPPHVPHDGRSALRGVPFRKRVLYLEAGWLPARAVGAAVAAPETPDARTIAAARRVHAALASPPDAMAAEERLLALRALLLTRLGGHGAPTAADPPLARRLRRLLDDRLAETLTLAEAGGLLGAHPSHLARVFVHAYGISPHRYVTGRRLDRARRLLLAGARPAEAAVAAGFHDQPHLTRHFRRLLGTTPAAFAAAAG